jgi:cell division protease FtsH
MPPPQGEQSQPQKPQPPRLLWWWVILGTLLVWNAIIFWPRPVPEATIPYTTFLEQVRADNVAHALVVGDRISGSFVKSIQWRDETAATRPGEPSKAEAKAYKDFRTTLPAAVGDPGLLPLLEKHHVEVEAKSTSTPWVVDLLASWAPLLLLLGVFWWMGRQATRNQAGLFGFGRSRARRYTSERPQVTFNDVAGADEAKADLQEEVDFLRHPGKYHDLGAAFHAACSSSDRPARGRRSSRAPWRARRASRSSA